MGADAGVHVVDDALHGSDAIGTSLVLAKALGTLPWDLVDPRAPSPPTRGWPWCRRCSPSASGVPQLTFAEKVDVDGPTVADPAADRRRATTPSRRRCPPWCRVVEKINEPRYPSFKGIMAAKKKPVTTLSLADLGVERRTRSGLAGAWTAVTRTSRPRPPQAGGHGRQGRGGRRRQARRVPRVAEVHLRSDGSTRRWQRSWSSSTHVDGDVKKVTTELLTLARRLGEPRAVLVGARLRRRAREAGRVRRREGLRRRRTPTARRTTSSRPAAEVLAAVVADALARRGAGRLHRRGQGDRRPAGGQASAPACSPTRRRRRPTSSPRSRSSAAPRRAVQGDPGTPIITVRPNAVRRRAPRPARRRAGRRRRRRSPTPPRPRRSPTGWSRRRAAARS